jgi:alkylhydroperoxidase family enzyme
VIKYLIGRQINAHEKSLGASLDYLRHILRVSMPDFWRVRRLGQLNAQRRALPPAPFHVARLIAVMAEDCGDCVQIEVNLARSAGVRAEILRSTLAARPSELPQELADVYLFAECIVHNSGDIEPLRGKMRQRYGEQALVEMSLAIALARTFPAIKRGMGYASACNLRSLNVA